VTYKIRREYRTAEKKILYNNIRERRLNFNPTFLEVSFLVVCALCLLKSFDELVYIETF
jgi:hypothetical protein